MDWLYDEPDERESDPEMKLAIVNYIIQQQLFKEAGRASNPRIRAYIDRLD